MPNAYNESKEEALKMALEQLEKLFTEQGSSDMMDYTSRAYGMLLHASSARKEEERHIRNIIKQVSIAPIRGHMIYAILSNKFRCTLSYPKVTCFRDLKPTF